MTVAPPFPRLPSLNALRAFEASARLGGFALAAEELRVNRAFTLGKDKVFAPEKKNGSPRRGQHERQLRQNRCAASGQSTIGGAGPSAKTAHSGAATNTSADCP